MKAWMGQNNILMTVVSNIKGNSLELKLENLSLKKEKEKQQMEIDQLKKEKIKLCQEILQFKKLLQNSLNQGCGLRSNLKIADSKSFTILPMENTKENSSIRWNVNGFSELRKKSSCVYSEFFEGFHENNLQLVLCPNGCWNHCYNRDHLCVSLCIFPRLSQSSWSYQAKVSIAILNSANQKYRITFSRYIFTKNRHCFKSINYPGCFHIPISNLIRNKVIQTDSIIIECIAFNII